MRKSNRKDKILKLVNKSDSFIVLYMEKDGDEVHYSEHNISNADIIAACEVVKSKILKKVVK